MAFIDTLAFDLHGANDDRARAIFDQGNRTVDLDRIATSVAALLQARDFEASLWGDIGKDIAPAALAMWANATASAIHLEMHCAFAAGGGDGDVAALAAEAERSYLDALMWMQIAAIGGAADMAQSAYLRLVGPHLASLSALLQAAGGTGVETGRAAQACHLARRTAMLAAFYPELDRRLRDARLAGSTAKLAKNRKVLALAGPDMADAVGSFAGIEPATRVSFCGRIGEGKYIPRGEKPYTRLPTIGGEQLRVHFKNTIWLGIGEDQEVWARCKVEEPDGAIAYAVTEFEGPTTTQGSVWEAWIQAEVRDAYDLAPESIHLFPAFPPAGGKLAWLHFIAHCQGSASDA